MRPHHGRDGAESLPQTSEPPFMVSYQLSSNVGDPITGKQIGFMCSAAMFMNPLL